MVGTTFVLAYAQEPAKSGAVGNLSIRKRGETPTYTQGMAWIDAEKYQIVRLTSDLWTPLPQVRLDRRDH